MLNKFTKMLYEKWETLEVDLSYHKKTFWPRTKYFSNTPLFIVNISLTFFKEKMKKMLDLEKGNGEAFSSSFFHK